MSKKTPQVPALEGMTPLGLTSPGSSSIMLSRLDRLAASAQESLSNGSLWVERDDNGSFAVWYQQDRRHERCISDAMTHAECDAFLMGMLAMQRLKK